MTLVDEKAVKPRHVHQAPCLVQQRGQNLSRVESAGRAHGSSVTILPRKSLTVHPQRNRSVIDFGELSGANQPDRQHEARPGQRPLEARIDMHSVTDEFTVYSILSSEI